LQRNDPHACIKCANGWFRSPLSSPPVAKSESAMHVQLADSASGDMEWLQGVWKLLENALQHRRTVELAVHLAGYVAEALCILAAPQAAVEVLLWGLSGLARRTARDHVRCMHCALPSLSAASSQHAEVNECAWRVSYSLYYPLAIYMCQVYLSAAFARLEGTWW
jgi:hypothetical protein